MIFGLKDHLFNTSKADKVYGVERAVMQELVQRGHKLPVENYDSESAGFIATPQTNAVYTLIGFNPKVDPTIAPALDNRVETHDSRESILREFEKEHLLNYIDHFLGDGKSIVKSQRPYLKKLEADNPQVDKKMRQYKIADFDFPYLRFNQSGKILYEQNKSIFSQVLTDIIEPLCLLGREEQIEYLKELKDIKYKDFPSIICVAASSDIFKLARGLK